MVQQGVDVSDAGPVPAGNTGQHLREAAGVLLPTVEPMVPQELLICPLQPGDRAARRGGGNTMFSLFLFVCFVFKSDFYNTLCLSVFPGFNMTIGSLLHILSTEQPLKG